MNFQKTYIDGNIVWIIIGNKVNFVYVIEWYLITKFTLNYFHTPMKKTVKDQKSEIRKFKIKN